MAANPRTTPEPRPATGRGRFPREESDYREPAPARAPADWRQTVATASGLNLIAGIWLIIAPFVLGYANGDHYWNDIVFGAIVAFFALIRIAGAYRAEWLSWLNALIGAWVFASAFWLDSSGRAQWNDIILGAIVFVLGLISATARRETAYAERPWYGR
jgi:hypothetical protein